MTRLRLPQFSLRQRIFFAMVTGALMVYLVAGWAIMNRISDAFNLRVSMESQSKAKLAEQFYRQQEDQLAHTAHFLAGMTLVSTGVSSNDGSSIAAESSRLRKSTQLNEDDSILIYDNQGKLLYSDLKPAPKRPSAAVLAVLKGSELLGSDLDVIAGQPSLIGVAAIQVGGEREGVVAVVRPFDRRLLNAIEAQTGSPCFIFDASGHLLGTSSGVTAWPAVALPAAPHGSAAHPAALASATATSNASTSSNVYLMPLFNNEWNLVGTMAFYRSTREMRSSQFTVQGLFLALLFAAFLVSATIAWLFSRMIAKPIQQLALATDEIASGQYDHPITVRGSDEIGHLTIAFERMRRRIREATAALTDEKARSEAEAAVVNAVLNATNDGIMMVDSQRHLRVINQRWAGMFGLNTAALHGVLADDLHYQLSLLMDEPEKFREASRALLEDSSRYVLDEEWVQRSPESRYLRRFSAPVRAADGSVIGRVFVYANVTREHEADELKQALLSTVSHELRTPLATIKGYARTLLLEDWDVDTRRDFIHIIDEEADKLSELVGNLLDLSKLEAGVLQIQRQPVRLDALLRRVIGRQHDPKQTHVYRVELPGDLPLTWADPRRIEQVVENLIENSTKYSQGGEIMIRARDQGDFVEITVQDHGQGIPQDFAERIFERFYRMDNRLTRETGGTGLGLSICRGLVEAHGGRIWVKETSSRGTTIAFTVPVLTSRIDETPPSPSNTVPVTLP